MYLDNKLFRQFITNQRSVLQHTIHTEHKGEESTSMSLFSEIRNILNVNSQSYQIHTTPANNSNSAMPFPINGIIDLLNEMKNYRIQQ